ncbi:MAG: autotransporter-associated beta strand repeat-containing protein [Thermoguttaceae bacterium]|nr:autotransporter-associated beta strand repeat-containing protein [Thermoguttaceae bacterium]
MAVVKSCSRQISVHNSFIAVIAALVVGLFVSSAHADRVIYTNGDTIPNPVIGDAVSGDLEFNANTANIEFSGAVNDVSSSIPTNFFATGEKQVWLRGSNLFTGVSTVECNALAFKGNAANVTITSAGFAGSTKVAFESLNNSNAKNMSLVLTADSSQPQPFTGTFQINGQSRLYFSSDANLSAATLKLNSGASNNFTEASFNMTAKTASFNSVTCENQYVRILNINSSKNPADLNTISFKSGTFTGEMGRYGNGGSDIEGKSSAFVNYFNLTKASDGTDNGGTLTLSGPVYYKGKTTIDGGTLVVSNSDFVSTSDLVGSGTLKLSGNNRYFNIVSNTPSDFTGTIQIADSSISGNVRVKLAAATYSWSNNALQTAYSATDVNLPKATLLLDGNPSGKFAELAFNNKNSSLTIGTLNGNTYGRILNLDSSITTATYNNLTVSNGNYAGEIGRSNDTSYPYVNHINFIKANDGSADGGTLTFSNKYILYDGTTTIEGGTLEITNSLSDNNYQYFARSTALKGSGNLNFTGSNWTVFDINAADTTTPQEFTGTVSVAENSKIMIKTENNAVKDLNLANATLNVGTGSTIGLHSINNAVSSLTVKELNTQSGSEVRICSNNPGSNYGTLTVGRGEINGTLGQNNSAWNNVNLVKVSDGSEDGGTLTIKGQDYYTGATTIDGGTLCFENNGTGYKYFTASTALKGSGTLDLQGNDWIGFSINADAAEPQEFTGTVNVKNKIMIRAADNTKNLNLGNGTLHLEENALVGLHVQGGEISALTVKELNTEPGSTVRLCSANPGAGKFGTLTVGSGTVNGNLGEDHSTNKYYNQVNLVKVSDGSDDGGTLTISGTNFYTGSIDIQEGTLKLTDAATLSQGATTIGEAGVLEFNVANGEKQVSITTANPISGSGAIVKSGAGILKVDNLDSPNTISAESFTVNAGELDFRGYFEGDIEIINGAVFSPGNSVGTLSVTGDVSIINGTALFEFGDYTGADENHDVLTILGADNLFTAGNGMISLAFDGDPNAWATDGGEYKLVSNEGFTVGDKSSWLSNYTDLFSLDGRSDGLYLVAGASPTPEPGSGVPEPSTWALLVLGVVVLFLRKRVRS